MIFSKEPGQSNRLQEFFGFFEVLVAIRLCCGKCKRHEYKKDKWTFLSCAIGFDR